MEWILNRDNFWNIQIEKSGRSFNSFRPAVENNSRRAFRRSVWATFVDRGRFWGVTVPFSSLFWLIVLPTFLVLSSSVAAGGRWGIMEFPCITAWCWYALPVAHSNCINHGILWQKYGRSTFSANACPPWLQYEMFFWGWWTPSWLPSGEINRSKHQEFAFSLKVNCSQISQEHWRKQNHPKWQEMTLPTLQEQRVNASLALFKFKN